jgi:ferredoxin
MSRSSRYITVDEGALRIWLSRIGERTRVFAPKRGPKGVDWAELDEGGLPDLDSGLPLNSIKVFYFPQPEILFTFNARPGQPDSFRLKEPEDAGEEIVVAGVRPCDARSIALNSLPYAEDPYFQARIDRLYVIGFPCIEGCSTCFCSWVGGGPGGTDGMDVAVWQMPEGHFVIEAVTEKGGNLMVGLQGAGPVAEPSEEELLHIEQWRKKGTGQRGEDPSISMRHKELMACYEAPFWQQVADCCINCGTCTFLCPTCYCFDIQDEKARGVGRRIRYWDSCMFPLFTQHASGHNPRGEKIKRVRNRFMHKFKYFVDRFGPLSCVGCGRCIRQCPVNIDIRQVLRDLLAL